MFETMPSPASTETKSGKYGPYGQTKREVKTRWVLNPEAEGVPKVVVDLFTSHWGDRKVLSTSLTWGTIEPTVPGSQFHVETWSSSNKMVRIHTTPVARYSVKAMEAHHEAAMGMVTDFWGTGVEQVFVEAAGHSGLMEMGV